MSSIKYDKDVCETIYEELKNISNILSSAENELITVINNVPSDDAVDDAITEKSKVAKTGGRYGTTTIYKIDEDKRKKYRENEAATIDQSVSNLYNAKKTIVASKESIQDIEKRIESISSLIEEYESKKVEEEQITVMTGSAGGGGSSGGGGSYSSVVPMTGSTLGTIMSQTGIGTTKLNVDTNNDGKPDYNIDTNGDGKADLNIDTNNDGKPDLNIDVNGDGKADLNIDVDNDGKPDYNIDLNGDGKADLNIDTNNDGKPDLNIDLDGDGKADLNIDTDGDGKPDLNIDTNGDGKVDLNADLDGDGKPDKNIATENEADKQQLSNKVEDDVKEFDDSEQKSEAVEKHPSNSDLFKEEEADGTKEGFVDNIIAGTTPTNRDYPDENTNGITDPNFMSNTLGGAAMMGGATAGTLLSGGSSLSNSGGSSKGGSSKDDESSEVISIDDVDNQTSNEEGQLFPFLPDGTLEGDEEGLLYRGLEDISPDEKFNLNSIEYNAQGAEGAVVKGAATLGAVGLGLAGIDAAATFKENKKAEEDGDVTSVEKEERKLIKTMVSVGILGVVSIGYIILSLMPSTSLLTIVLLGIAMAISSITAISGNKIGKYVGFGVVLVVSLLAFMLSAFGVISPIAYVVVFATYIILAISAVVLDLLKGMFDDKIELIPIIIAIAVGLFFGMLKVIGVIGWIIFIILVGLTIGGYFLWDKVLKYKIPDDEDENNYNNVSFKTVQSTEGNLVNIPEQEKFDPRKLYMNDQNIKPTFADSSNNQSSLSDNVYDNQYSDNTNVTEVQTGINTDSDLNVFSNAFNDSDNSGNKFF